MDNLMKENSKIMKQINSLTDSVALIQKYDDIKDQPLFHKLLQGIMEAENQIKITNKLLRRDLAIARKEYDEVMRELRETQANILHFLVKTKKKKIAEAECLKTPLQKATLLLPNYLQESNSSLPRSFQKQIISSTLKQAQLKFDELAVTPKISIKEYKESPLVKNSKKMIQFDLLEFDVHITIKQFESIPKYMRGRISFDELQNFLENIIVQCFNEKYKLLHRTRTAVQNTKEFELWKVFHSQKTYAPGRNFITAGDIARKMERMIDKKTQNLLTMIRHVGILQEQRISQTTCYIWISKS